MTPNPFLDSDDDDNRRSAPRRDIQETLFIQTVRSDQVVPLDEMKTVSTVNASACGLQVAMDFEVLVDSEIVLWITHANSRVMVSGTVRWTRPQGENGYLVGIQIDEDAVPEMKRWIGERTPA